MEDLGISRWCFMYHIDENIAVYMLQYSEIPGASHDGMCDERDFTLTMIVRPFTPFLNGWIWKDAGCVLSCLIGN